MAKSEASGGVGVNQHWGGEKSFFEGIKSIVCHGGPEKQSIFLSKLNERFTTRGTRRQRRGMVS